MLIWPQFLPFGKQFNIFSQASGLIANLEKCVVYFVRTSAEMEAHINNVLGMTKGELPFRYLGVPLSSKKLTLPQCRMVCDKITARLQMWTIKFLSYGGRLQLLKSVVEGIHSFWSQIFLLPKRVLKMIDIKCRSFLW